MLRLLTDKTDITYYLDIRKGLYFNITLDYALTKLTKLFNKLPNSWVNVVMFGWSATLSSGGNTFPSKPIMFD